MICDVGLIINVASAGGIWPMPMAPVYATAKSGVIHFTRSVAPRLKKRNIRICALCPQQVDTPMVTCHSPHPRIAALYHKAYVAMHLASKLSNHQVFDAFTPVAEALHQELHPVLTSLGRSSQLDVKVLLAGKS